MKNMFKSVKIGLVTTSMFLCFFVNASQQKELDIDTGITLLNTATINPVTSKKNPNIKLINTPSVAGYLSAEISGKYYQLVAIPVGPTIKYKTKYITYIDVINIDLINSDGSGSKKNKVTREVIEYWIRVGMKNRPEYKIVTHPLGTMLVAIMSDMPYTEILNMNASMEDT